MLSLILLLALAIPSAIGTQPDTCDELNFQFPLGSNSAACSNKSSEDFTPKKFIIDVDNIFIEQTIQKVKLYRPPIAINDDVDWTDGPPPHALRKIADYWEKNYDWLEIQRSINDMYSHYTTTVQGTRNYTHPIHIHFIHERSNSAKAIPLLLLHGWPSNVMEWSKVIHPLANGSDNSASFHVVAVDLPG